MSFYTVYLFISESAIMNVSRFVLPLPDGVPRIWVVRLVSQPPFSMLTSWVVSGLAWPGCVASWHHSYLHCNSWEMNGRQLWALWALWAVL